MDNILSFPNGCNGFSFPNRDDDVGVHIPTPNENIGIGANVVGDDVNVNVDDVYASSFDYSQAASNVLSNVKNGVATVTKTAAVVTGVGVLGVMAGSTALAVKSYNKKDEACASVGESMSYFLAKFLGGNDSMAVQRLQQAGMRGVDMGVQNKRAVRKAVRPLPTLNMPVASDTQMSY